MISKVTLLISWLLIINWKMSSVQLYWIAIANHWIELNWTHHSIDHEWQGQGWYFPCLVVVLHRSVKVGPVATDMATEQSIVCWGWQSRASSRFQQVLGQSALSSFVPSNQASSSAKGLVLPPPAAGHLLPLATSCPWHDQMVKEG